MANTIVKAEWNAIDGTSPDGFTFDMVRRGLGALVRLVPSRTLSGQHFPGDFCLFADDRALSDVGASLRPKRIMNNWIETLLSHRF